MASKKRPDWIQEVVGGETLQVAPLASKTYDHGQWQNHTYGTLLPSDTLATALAREGFDPASRARYTNARGTHVEFYAKPGVRPGQFLAFIRVAASQGEGIPSGYYLPNEESVDTFLSDFALEAEAAAVPQSSEFAA